MAKKNVVVEQPDAGEQAGELVEAGLPADAPDDTSQSGELAEVAVHDDGAGELVPENPQDPKTNPDAPPNDDAAPDTVECAVLLDCIYGKHDDIIVLSIAEAAAAKAGGYVDTHPNAIAAIRRG